MIRRYAFLALLVAACAAAQPAAPDTPAGKVFTAWLTAFNSADRQQIQVFDETYRRDAPPVSQTLTFRERTGGFELVRVEKSDETTLVALVTERAGDTVARVELSLDAVSPPKIARMDLRAIPRPSDLALPRLNEADALGALSARVEELAKKDQFSGALLVARRGKILYEKAYGRANREAGTPNGTKTQFRIGSMNKMFTSIAILRLVDAGKLKLEDPIGKHLSDYPNKDVATKVPFAISSRTPAEPETFLGRSSRRTGSRCASTATISPCTARARSATNREPSTGTRTTVSSCSARSSRRCRASRTTITYGAPFSGPPG